MMPNRLIKTIDEYKLLIPVILVVVFAMLKSSTIISISWLIVFIPVLIIPAVLIGVPIAILMIIGITIIAAVLLIIMLIMICAVILIVTCILLGIWGLAIELTGLDNIIKGIKEKAKSNQ